VLLVNGRKAFKYRVDLPALRARLARDSAIDAPAGGR
jgi:hypothetical protein